MAYDPRSVRSLATALDSTGIRGDAALLDVLLPRLLDRIDSPPADWDAEQERLAVELAAILATREQTEVLRGAGEETVAAIDAAASHIVTEIGAELEDLGKGQDQQTAALDNLAEVSDRRGPFARWRVRRALRRIERRAASCPACPAGLCREHEGRA